MYIPTLLCVFMLVWKWPILLSAVILTTVTASGLAYLFLSEENNRKKMDNLMASYLFPEESKSKTEANGFLKTAPWCGIELSERTNSKLEELILFLVSDYVDRWYTKEISADNTFLVEIKYQIRYGAAIAFRALKNYDFVDLIEKDVLPMISLHIAKRLQSPNENFNNHLALRADKNFEIYLREVADILVIRLFDKTRIGGAEMDSDAPTTSGRDWPSETCRHFLRELFLSTVLIPVIKFISEPDNINNLIITAARTDSDQISLKDDPKVPFLQKLTEYSLYDTPDSLLMLNLKELSKNCQLVQEFYTYLKDAHGPVYWLDFFFAADELLHDLHGHTKEAESLVRTAGNLYNIYIDPLSKKSVQLLSQQLREDTQKAITEGNIKELNVLFETIYKDLYQELNYSFVVPFCQSESYLRSLCGTTVDGIDIMKEKESSSSGSVTTNKPEMEEEAKALEAIDASFLDIENYILDDPIDMKNWTVTISAIEPKKKFYTGKVYYTYRIDVNRNEENEVEDIDLGIDPLTVNDLDDSDDDFVDCAREEKMSQLPTKWSISRTYDEFFVFESHLCAFYGRDWVLTKLPDRKMFCPRSRMFLESQRDYLERFLYMILQMDWMKKSMMVYLFLTNPSDCGYESSLINTNRMNPMKSVKKVTDSLETDKKQYLKPFVLRLLAQCLTNENEYAFTEMAATVKYISSNETDYWKDEITSYDSHSMKLPFKTDAFTDDELVINTQQEISRFLARILSEIYNESTIFTHFLAVVSNIFPVTSNRLIRKGIRSVVEKVLTPEAAYSLSDSLFKLVYHKESQLIADEEKQKNYIAAKKVVLGFLKIGKLNNLDSLNAVVLKIFGIFQSNTDNKQLILTWLDLAITKITAS